MALNPTNSTGITGEGGFWAPTAHIVARRVDNLERAGYYVTHGGKHSGTKSQVRDPEKVKAKRKQEKKARRRGR